MRKVATTVVQKVWVFMGARDVGSRLDPSVLRLHGRDFRGQSSEWADEPIAQTLALITAQCAWRWECAIYIVLNDCQRAQDVSKGFRSSVYTKLYWRFRRCQSFELGMPVEGLEDGFGKGGRIGAVDRAAHGKELDAVGDELASEIDPRKAPSLWNLSKAPNQRSRRLGPREGVSIRKKAPG